PNAFLTGWSASRPGPKALCGAVFSALRNIWLPPTPPKMIPSSFGPHASGAGSASSSRWRSSSGSFSISCKARCPMTLSAPSDATTVIVISSHVVRGSVGNRAAVFALETLGFPVWAVPTVVLPWHPGHGVPGAPAGRIVPPAEEFSRLMQDLQRAPWLGEVGAVLTGYLGHPEQAAAVA